MFAGERVHGDDTTIPVLARGKTITGRAWVYVRDDRPFGGRGPPAAVFHTSVIAQVITRSVISMVMPASYKPTLMLGSTSSTNQLADRDL